MKLRQKIQVEFSSVHLDFSTFTPFAFAESGYIDVLDCKLRELAIRDDAAFHKHAHLWLSVRDLSGCRDNLQRLELPQCLVLENAEKIVQLRGLRHLTLLDDCTEDDFACTGAVKDVNKQYQLLGEKLGPQLESIELVAETSYFDRKLPPGNVDGSHCVSHHAAVILEPYLKAIKHYKLFCNRPTSLTINYPELEDLDLGHVRITSIGDQTAQSLRSLQLFCGEFPDVERLPTFPKLHFFATVGYMGVSVSPKTVLLLLQTKMPNITSIECDFGSYSSWRIWNFSFKNTKLKNAFSEFKEWLANTVADLCQLKNMDEKYEFLGKQLAKPAREREGWLKWLG